MPNPKEPIRLIGDHLRANPRRQYGKQSGRLVPCQTKPDLHGHYPENEYCPACRSWAEMMEEQAKRAPAPSMEPVKIKSPGRRLWEKYAILAGSGTGDHAWYCADHSYWENEAAREFGKLGPSLFDASYP